MKTITEKNLNMKLVILSSRSDVFVSIRSYERSFGDSKDFNEILRQLKIILAAVVK